MGKRSSFKRLRQDKYRTPPPPIRFLLPHLKPGTSFVEPCAGNGQLARTLERHGYVCRYMCDVRPDHGAVDKHDARLLRRCDLGGARAFITNPPWTRPLLHELIEHLPTLLSTWLLFDADWAHTAQARQYLDRCSEIVSVGRVKWIKNSKSVGLDNCAWYHFPIHYHGPTKFTGLSGHR